MERVEKAMEDKGEGREVCSKRREMALVETYSVKLPVKDNSSDISTEREKFAGLLHDHFTLFDHLEGKLNWDLVVDKSQFNQVGKERDQLRVDGDDDGSYSGGNGQEVQPCEMGNEGKKIIRMERRGVKKEGELTEKAEMEGMIPAKLLNDETHGDKEGLVEGGRVKEALGENGKEGKGRASIGKEGKKKAGNGGSGRSITKKRKRSEKCPHDLCVVMR